MTVVLVVGMTPTPGGVESFIRNYYSEMDHTRIRFDFLCSMKGKIAYEEEFRSEGSKIYHITSKRENLLKYKRELRYFFLTYAKQYDVIWVNVNSLVNIDFLVYAKKYGIKKRIIHSHNSCNMNGKLTEVLHRINRKRIDHYANEFWACSKEAAKWFYRDDILPKARVIHNAIHVDQYLFNAVDREKYREELGLKDKIAVVNVGRLHFQKNQEFAIKVFQKAYEKDQRLRLILVGDGEDREKLEQQVQKLGLTDYVTFTGIRYDVNRMLSAFDLFLFPSVFEGLSIVALEAQANGLPILASDKAVTDENTFNSNVVRLSLDSSAEQWTNSLLKMAYNSGRVSSEITSTNLAIGGFDIKKEAPRLEAALERA